MKTLKISMLYSHKVYFLLLLHVFHWLAKALLQGICFLGPRMTEQHLSEYHKYMAEEKENWQIRQGLLELRLKYSLCHLGSHFH